MNLKVEENRSKDLSGLEFRQFENSDSELAQTSELLQRVWPDAQHLNFEYLKWQYVENPVGPAQGFNVWHEDKIVGHYATIPVISEISGAQEKGLLSLNTAVDESFRGKNLFKILASKTYDAALSEGYSFVIGVANQNSTLLFKRQLKFQIVCPLSVKIGLGKICFKNDFEDGINFKMFYSDDWMSWRLRRPASRYSKSGRLILADSGQYGIQAQLLDPDVYSLQSGEVRFCKESSKRVLFNPLRLWIGLGDVRAVGAFFELPEKLKPSPLNLIFKDLTEAKRTLDPRKCLFQLVDFDAY